jgi:sulfatase maturation enzyme AslB (radical SAM superfamily)
VIKVHKGATFTPYANPKKCPANCAYCSENLKVKGRPMNSSPRNFIKDQDKYFKSLEELLQLLQNQSLVLGFSFSGLEATADVEWFKRICDIYAKYKGSLFNTGVLYSNGANIL